MGGSFTVGENKSVLSFTWDGSRTVVNGAFGYKSVRYGVAEGTVLGGQNATVKEGLWSLDGPQQLL
jgi:hypothetical protein